MSYAVALLPPDLWLQQIFDSKAARQGGIVRRKARDVERTVGRERFVREIKRRGFHCVENGGQFVVFCNNEQVHVLC
ncbi:N-(5'-phosphoribosyl)anthranilate isomerase [Cognatishimia sp. MH4019]|uniref:N-(5'-phosphoribosyl)anthranilate isomerase n=1 Tax=Cognatishimia sp. MH4019 TaxID=2854030 RepID=UPI001CD6B7E2|nr:N-(5'-phosphoribosyl)anthranilate isomerase [Cognatishimia sp. MH4019]